MAAVFADKILRRILLNENVRLSIKISLNIIPYGPIDKPLSEPMMTQFIYTYYAALGGDELTNTHIYNPVFMSMDWL